MKLFTKCLFCNSLFATGFYAGDRGELVRNKGEEIKLQCRDCMKNNVVHPNDIFAKPNQIFIGIGIIIGVILMLFLLGFGYISVIALGIPTLIWKLENKSVHDFNTLKINRTKN